STNLYTINLHEMASASPICLMARVSSTKSWLWHQRLSHLNFDTINDLARNDRVSGLPKFKYHKEYLCPSCEQGKSKRASHPPKHVLNSRQRLHLLHMDLCGPMRITSINGKRYILVIVDDYSRYTWVHFLRSKDEAPCHEPNSEGSGSAWKAYMNARVAGLFLLLFKKVSDQKDHTQDSSKNTKFAKQPNVEILPKVGKTNALSKPVTSNSVSSPQESKGVNNAKVIAPGMFRISPDKSSKEAKKVPNIVSASSRTKPITVSQPNVITK
nr:retrovirus-related Pol polyprotein from transposon TNT 1-94 [Tanacetum cinerariifolium]